MGSRGISNKDSDKGGRDSPFDFMAAGTFWIRLGAVVVQASESFQFILLTR